MQTTEVYLRADPTEKIEALEAVMPPALRRGEFTVPDKLIAWLFRTLIFPSKYKGFQPESHAICYFSVSCKFAFPENQNKPGGFEDSCPSHNMVCAPKSGAHDILGV
jgi:hypothetical protein